MGKAILIISIACLIFLLSLQVLYYISYSNQIIQIFAEMFTISSMMFVIFAFFFSLINVFRKKKEYNLVFGINVLTILISVAATVLD
ncbi:hypothetical protein [Chryseobacterium indoltheticum]|uniref:Uncharacterized protein n=1 Tax=Chryseobacterium indoltheticum TaxID=254 RepID=A0A381JR51_9FLAO|nr:hypothetical protein [Chryseobacterium indoltheticum]AZA75399.1 hypothetical protein EG358_17290 [Chryseobacterium indoltheticum]SIQ68759.1 hypothetical protein SAMN05421682_107142 [Chryseobacterium indoltheticum]SUY53505.1 Uncharacterised protein [Chryseobacterium indoltheticum]